MFDLLPPLAWCTYIMNMSQLYKAFKVYKMHQKHQKPCCYQYSNTNKLERRLEDVNPNPNPLTVN